MITYLLNFLNIFSQFFKILAWYQRGDLISIHLHPTLEFILLIFYYFLKEEFWLYPIVLDPCFLILGINFHLNFNQKNYIGVKNKSEIDLLELAARATSLHMAKSKKDIKIPKTAYEFEVTWRAISEDSALQVNLLKVLFTYIIYYMQWSI